MVPSTGEVSAPPHASAEVATLETLLRIRERRAKWSTLTRVEARRAVEFARPLVSWAEQVVSPRD